MYFFCYSQIGISKCIEKMESKELLFYQIEIQSNVKNWTVERQFAEFIGLAKHLKKLLLPVPKLPPKKLFKLKSITEIAERRDGLDRFLKELAHRPELLNQKAVCDFLMVRLPVT